MTAALTALFSCLFPFASLAVLRSQEFTVCGIRAALLSKRRLNLAAYTVLPLLTICLYLWRRETSDIFSLLQSYLLIFFGFLAAMEDLRSKTIPNVYVLAMLSAWLLTMVPQLAANTDTAVSMIFNSLWGFLLGGGLFFIVYLVSKKGLGGGDVKFMAAAGLYLGLNGVLPAMLYGSIAASVAGLILILIKRMGRKDSMPLAPFLYFGIILTIYFL